MLLKLSTAKTVSFGPFLDKTDGVTPETGLVSALDHASTGIKLSKNGGALTIRAATVTATTYDGYGNYIVTLKNTDTDTLGTLRMQFIETATCLPVWMDFMVLPATVYDALVTNAAGGANGLLLSLASNQVDVGKLLGTAWLAPAVAGTPDVNAKLVGGTAQTGRDIGASVLLSSGTGTGQLKLASGYVAMTWADIAAPTTTVNLSGTTVKTATDIATLIGVAGVGLTNVVLPAGGLANVTAWTVNVTGSLSGTVGSVTGAVGSVTGNVGGNVTGTIGGFTVPAKAELQQEAEDALAAVGATSARFGYVDNLNVGGAVASSAQVTGLNVNTRANLLVPNQIETPDAGTQVFKVRLHLFDSVGNMEAPDSTPTVTLANAAGTDRSSRLSVASNPSTGVYTWDYTATAADAEEQLVWVFTVVEGAVTRTFPANSYVVEYTAYRFDSSDRTKLNALHAKLPSKSYFAGTNNSDGDVQMDEATGNFPGSVASVAGAVGSVTGNVVGTVASVVGAVGSVTGNVGGDVVGSVGSALDLGTAAKAAVNVEADAALADVGLTATVTGRVDAAISTRSTLTQTQVTGGAYSIQSASCVLGDGRIANLDAAITSRMATYAQPAGFLAATFPTDPADQSLVIAATDALATLIGDVPTNSELTTAIGTADDATLAQIALVKAKTDLIPAAPAAVGDIPTVSQIWTTALTEAYRATGAAGTAAQLLNEIIAHLGDSSISGTTKTINNRAGSVAKTYTLNSATLPTAIAEAT